MKQMADALQESGAVPPRARMIMLPKCATKLDELLRHGVTEDALGGGEVRVTFEQMGKPFKPRAATGWRAVKVRSSFGAITTLLMDVDGSVSGLLKLRRGRP